jgi:ACS family hexuronate transporter-like MFS transporter
MTARERWFVAGVFFLSSTLNFLDRQLLSALAPEIMRDFSLTKGQFGDLLATFSFTYALASPAAGLLLDRVGLVRGSSWLVGLWSLAGMATGLVQSFGALLLARAALGVTEAGSIPATGKANGLYLRPEERSLGAAANQVGLMIGAVMAPLAGQWIATHYGWRTAFFSIGALGFVWIPAWLAAARRYPPVDAATAGAEGPRELLRDPRFWYMCAANMAVMTVYSLWLNWTTVFLVERHGLAQADANARLAWMPQICGTLGGFFGGWLSLRWSARLGPLESKVRAILVGTLLVLVTALIPFSPSAGWTTAGICASFFACLVCSVNIYTVPIDLFGPRRAGFAIAGLTFAYGLLQAVFSSVAGRVVDWAGSFTPLLWATAGLPLLGYFFTRAAVRRKAV